MDVIDYVRLLIHKSDCAVSSLATSDIVRVFSVEMQRLKLAYF